MFGEPPSQPEKEKLLEVSCVSSMMKCYIILIADSNITYS